MGTNANITVLSANRSYDVQVMATGSGAHIDSDYSVTESVTTDKIKLDAPTFGDITASNSTTIYMEWNEEGNTSGYAVTEATGYKVRYRTGEGKWEDEIIITETSTTITPLLPGTLYELEVCAITNTEESAWSAPVWVMTDPLVLPMTPTELDCTEKTTDSITLEWDAVNNATSYEVRYKKASDGEENWGEPSVYNSPATIFNLSAGTAYEFQVRAVNGDGNSEWSNEVFATTLCNSPTELTGTPMATDILLSWNAPTGVVTSYQVQRSNNGTSDWTTIDSTSDTALGWEDTNTLYKEAVSNVFSSVNVIVQLDPPTLGNITATGNSISVSWDGISNTNGYKVQYSTDSTFNTGTVTVNASNSSTKITGLYTNTIYYVRVMANGTNSYSDSGYSLTKSVTTEQEPDPPLPGVVPDNTRIDKTLATVKGVKFDKKDSKPTLTSLAFTWTPTSTFSADEVTFDVWVPKTKTVPAKLVATATVTWEQLTALTVGGEPLTIPSGDCTITITAKSASGKNYLEMKVCGLNAGTKYTIEMQAKNSDGSTPYSKVTKISASTAKYTAVKSLKRTAIGLYSVALTWKEPVKVPGNPTTGYAVKVYLATDKKLENSIESLTQIIPDTGATIEGLSSNTKYTIAVQAIAGELGVTSVIAKIGVTTLNPAKYPVVGGLKATVKDSTVTLSWKESKVPDTTHYEVEVRDVDGTEVRKFDAMEGVNSVTVSDKGVITIPPVTDLELGKYTILVRAVTVDGIKSMKDAKKMVTLK